MIVPSPPLRCIAFVGLGRMGTPMAARLIGGGFDLRLIDADPKAVQTFVSAHGGTACASLAEAAKGAHAVIAMLPSDAAVRAVMLGPRGIEGSLAPGGIAIDMGTSSPTATREIGHRLQLSGIGYVDAPVMGGVPFARDGTLEIMAAGDPICVERCGPLFATLARQVYRCNGSGTGHTLKAIANFVNAATLATFSEAMALGRRAGLDDAFIAQTLGTLCTGRQHPLEKKIIPHVLTRQFASGMAIGLTAKDLGIAAALGPQLDVPTPIAAGMHSLWQQAADRFGPNADQTEIARWWESDAHGAPGTEP